MDWGTPPGDAIGDALSDAWGDTDPLEPGGTWRRDRWSTFQGDMRRLEIANACLRAALYWYETPRYRRRLSDWQVYRLEARMNRLSAEITALIEATASTSNQNQLSNDLSRAFSRN